MITKKGINKGGHDKTQTKQKRKTLPWGTIRGDKDKNVPRSREQPAFSVPVFVSVLASPGPATNQPATLRATDGA